MTNVYLMGATAFALFANYEWTRDAWLLNDSLYQVALKAISKDRSQRQQSIEQFINEWKVSLHSF